MFNVANYLETIGYAGSNEPTLDTLRAVQKQHLMSVPFDNSVNANVDRGLSVWDDVDIDPDESYESIVVGGRGGVCYELNGLFRFLLTGMGYDYQILAGAVRQVTGGFGPDLEHIFGCVRLDGELWLVDVGIAGPHYIEPLRVTSEVQELYGVRYRMFESDGYWVVQRKPKTGDWQAIYRFRMQFRDIDEWNDPDPSLVEFPPGLVAVGTFIHSRATENGQIVLIGRRCLKVADGEESVRVLVDPVEYKETVNTILNPETRGVS
ncbi:amide synthase [Herbihabitans rhizosphaerae]|uniref:Amide synthase n=1 Tax=Herbihabitans rhizosphaerae TaxID=1872711 RepID=A0A4V2ES48_9PSEU|nr:arylamine N-acetyltransferase [Herbihabitans rhizosphaerae]RZS36323.1 amide synthase [Herbihabitans rhizosphaerae]